MLRCIVLRNAGKINISFLNKEEKWKSEEGRSQNALAIVAREVRTL